MWRHPRLAPTAHSESAIRAPPALRVLVVRLVTVVAVVGPAGGGDGSESGESVLFDLEDWEKSADS
ncbi:hypothetical protein [Botrimarina mediterranea]|uniref:hypothetical protein n=1 Tax=Botrimarina mediterranea TaxID=2528022 RepID=UPI001E465D9C|nr:hypothetical protein [Botrimarina mediterranea]